MKRLMISFFIALACSNAFGMQEDANKEVNIDKQVQENPHLRKDLIKGLAGLAGAGLFGSLSWLSHRQINTSKNNPYIIKRINSLIYENTTKKIITRLSPSSTKHYLKKNIGIVGNALIAFQCAKYGVNKIVSVIAAKTPENVKQKLSSVHSTITDKVQANWKRPFSWFISKLKSKLAQASLKNRE